MAVRGLAKRYNTCMIRPTTPADTDPLVALTEATGGKKDERVFLRADKSVPYGELMGAMNLLRAAGYLKVALVGVEQ